MSATTIKLSSGDLGSEHMLVRCDLSQASAPVEVNYCAEPGSDWESTQYQCADCRHRTEGLVEIGRELAARAVEMPSEQFSCQADEI